MLLTSTCSYETLILTKLHFPVETYSIENSSPTFIAHSVASIIQLLNTRNTQMLFDQRIRIQPYFWKILSTVTWPMTKNKCNDALSYPNHLYHQDLQMHQETQSGKISSERGPLGLTQEEWYPHKHHNMQGLLIQVAIFNHPDAKYGSVCCSPYCLPL